MMSEKQQQANLDAIAAYHLRSVTAARQAAEAAAYRDQLIAQTVTDGTATQTEIAALLGVSRQRVTNMLRNRRPAPEPGTPDEPLWQEDSDGRRRITLPMSPEQWGQLAGNP